MTSNDIDELETITKKKLVVTTIETKDGKVISETEDVRELNQWKIPQIYLTFL